jgi:hypothetical protein
MVAAAALLSLSSLSHAAPVYDTFGALPQATFGGSGIPNDAVAIGTFSNPAGNFTLGLAAHG